MISTSEPANVSSVVRVPLRQRPLPADAAITLPPSSSTIAGPPGCSNALDCPVTVRLPFRRNPFFTVAVRLSIATAAGQLLQSNKKALQPLGAAGLMIPRETSTLRPIVTIDAQAAEVNLVRIGGLRRAHRVRNRRGRRRLPNCQGLAGHWFSPTPTQRSTSEYSTWIGSVKSNLEKTNLWRWKRASREPGRP